MVKVGDRVKQDNRSSNSKPTKPRSKSLPAVEGIVKDHGQDRRQSETRSGLYDGGRRQGRRRPPGTRGAGPTPGRQTREEEAAREEPAKKQPAKKEEAAKPASAKQERRDASKAGSAAPAKTKSSRRRRRRSRTAECAGGTVFDCRSGRAELSRGAARPVVDIRGGRPSHGGRQAPAAAARRARSLQPHRPPRRCGGWREKSASTSARSRAAVAGGRISETDVKEFARHVLSSVGGGAIRTRSGSRRGRRNRFPISASGARSSASR